MGDTKATVRSAIALLLFIAVCQAAGLLGVATGETGSSDWYRSLEKPFFNPPSWLFGPVWTTLYVLMGVAAWLVWRSRDTHRSSQGALVLFAIQLVLNAAWTPIFFGAHRIGTALVVIVGLAGVLAATLWRFLRISRTAGILLVPYLLWLLFATVLNASLFWLNR